MDGNHLSLINGEVEIYFNNDKTMFGRRLNAKADFNTKVINEQANPKTKTITMEAGKQIKLTETETTTETETEKEITETPEETPVEERDEEAGSITVDCLYRWSLCIWRSNGFSRIRRSNGKTS